MYTYRSVGTPRIRIDPPEDDMCEAWRDFLAGCLTDMVALLSTGSALLSTRSGCITGKNTS